MSGCGTCLGRAFVLVLALGGAWFLWASGWSLWVGVAVLGGVVLAMARRVYVGDAEGL